MSQIRLGWETRADQLQLEIDVLAVGIAMLLTAALVDFSGVGVAAEVVLYLVGGLLTLIGLIRAHGWRTLLWSRNLVTGPEYLADTKSHEGFRHSWDTLAAVGVLVDPTAEARYGTTLVIFPRQGNVELRRVPRRKTVADAVRGGAPGAWLRTTGPWAALVTAPGVDPRTLPVPPTRDEHAVVVEVGGAIARQGLVGGVLAAFFGVCAVIGATQGEVTHGATRLAVALVGLPFCLIGLVTAISVLVLVRPRSIVLDRQGFTWDDPREESFAVAWQDLASLSVEMETVRNLVNGGRNSVHVVLVPKDHRLVEGSRELAKFAKAGRVVIPLADQPAAAAMIEQAATTLAPTVWQGSTQNFRRFGIT